MSQARAVETAVRRSCADHTSISVLPAQRVDNDLLISAILERPGERPTTVWYRISADIEEARAISVRADAFVVAFIFAAMRAGYPVRIHGAALSPTLARNLEEYQLVWASWFPRRYQQVDLLADIEEEPIDLAETRGTIVAFSGGVDASFTVFRHQRQLCGRRTRSIDAALMVHGFDIPVEDQAAFDSAAARARQMLRSIGVPLVTVATNLKLVGDVWEDAFAAATASCLMMFEGSYRVGLIGSSEPYAALLLPWGSNPLSDPMLSSGNFGIIHDGAEASRSQKVSVIARWPEALQFLRVCWQGQDRDRNCGRCEKCIRTMLNFRVMGLPTPPCFDSGLNLRDISQLRQLNAGQASEFQQLLKLAKQASISEPWVSEISRCVRRSQLKELAKKSYPIRLLRQTVLQNHHLAIIWERARTMI
jgi:hypothetical protein